MSSPDGVLLHFKYSILTKEKILLTHPHMVKSEKIGFNLEFTLSDVFLRKFERLDHNLAILSPLC